MSKQKQELIMLQGLPASGKSTIAAEYVAKGYKRVNKDDLRLMIDGGKWSHEREELIKDIEREIVLELLARGHSVVVDDTNFVYEKFWSDIAEDACVKFEVLLIDTPVMECIARDAKRGDKSVGQKVIFGMYQRYLKPQEPTYSDDKQNCWIFDIDGTLAKMSDRSPYDMSKVGNDKPNHNITMIARTLGASGLPIVIMSGRDYSASKDTLKWLNDNSIPCNHLIMREIGDIRKDSIVKKELYETYVKPKYNVLAVFDDRNQVVDMWRAEGLTCLQVDYGNF